MKKLFYTLMLGAFVSGLTPLPSAALEPTSFHQPQTEAEQSLDKILSSDKASGSDGIFLKPAGDSPPSQPETPSAFTKKFEKKIHENAKKKQEKDCKYGACGLRNTLTCGHAPPEDAVNTYRTLEEHNAAMAAVMVVSRDPSQQGQQDVSGPIYKMVLDEDGVWKLDDMVCGEKD